MSQDWKNERAEMEMKSHEKEMMEKAREKKLKAEQEKTAALINEHLEKHSLPKLENVPVPVFHTIEGALNDFFHHSMNSGSDQYRKMTNEELKSLLVRTLIHFKYGPEIQD